KGGEVGRYGDRRVHRHVLRRSSAGEGAGESGELVASINRGAHGDHRRGVVPPAGGSDRAAGGKAGGRREEVLSCESSGVGRGRPRGGDGMRGNTTIRP